MLKNERFATDYDRSKMWCCFVRFSSILPVSTHEVSCCVHRSVTLLQMSKEISTSWIFIPCPLILLWLLGILLKSEILLLAPGLFTLPSALFSLHLEYSFVPFLLQSKVEPKIIWCLYSTLPVRMSVPLLLSRLVNWPTSINRKPDVMHLLNHWLTHWQLAFVDLWNILEPSRTF